MTPLMLASSKGHFDVVQILLERHADPLLADDRTVSGLGRNSLHRAALKGHAHTVMLLIDWLKLKNKSLDGRDREGCTALLLACENEHWQCAEMLLLNGANLDKETTDGRSPRTISLGKHNF